MIYQRAGVVTKGGKTKMKRPILVLLLASMLALAFAGASSAVIITVPGDQPTIQAAVDSAMPYDQIIVAQGLIPYYESVVVNKSDITITGDSGDTSVPGPGINAPVLDGSTLGGSKPAFSISEGVSNVTIEGFEIQNYGPDSDTNADGVVVWNSGTNNIYIHDNYMHDLGYAGVLTGNGWGAPQGIHNNWQVSYNKVESVGAYAFDMENVTNSSVNNNEIKDIPYYNINIIALATEAGADITAENNAVSSNVITGATDRVINIMAWTDGGTDRTATVRNVSVTDNTVTGNFNEILAWKIGDGTLSIQDLTIDNNILNIIDPKAGGYAVQVSDVSGYSTLNNNNISLSGTLQPGATFFHAVNIGGAATGTWEIRGNMIDGNNIASGDVGIRLRSSLSASSVIKILEGNTITEFDNGISSDDLTGTSVEVHKTGIYQNTSYGIKNGVVGAQIDARNNWWGDSSGPTHSGNPGGTGDAVTDNVLYDPWQSDTRKFDCDDDDDGIDTMAGWTSFTLADYSAATGFGWDDVTGMEDRNRHSGDSLHTDLHFAANDKTFMCDVPDGDYIVTAHFRDATNGHDNIDVSAEGVLKLDNVTIAAGETKALSFNVTVTDGQLDLLFHDDGGDNPHWVVDGIEFAPNLYPGFYWKDHNGELPGGYMPDIDQNQDFSGDIIPDNHYCAPVAEANSLWWLDKKYHIGIFSDPENGLGYIGGDINHDHSPPEYEYPLGDLKDLVQDLAIRMLTNIGGINGTLVINEQVGIESFLSDYGLTGKLYEHTVDTPNFALIAAEVERCQDVKLDLGFWHVEEGPLLNPATQKWEVIWRRVGGHAVTVAGVDMVHQQLAISDPYFDAAENGAAGVIRPVPNGHDPHAQDPTVHNNEVFASHDIYGVLPPAGQLVSIDPPQQPLPQVPWILADYPVAYPLIPSELADNNGITQTVVVAYDVPPPLQYCMTFTLIEAAVIVSPVTPPIQSAIDPSSATAGDILTGVVVTGSDFQSGAQVTLEKQGETTINGANEATYNGGQSIMVDFDLTGAVTGDWSVVVTNPDGGVCTTPVTFTVNAQVPPPTQASIDPPSAMTGATLTDVVVAGTGFQDGAQVTLEKIGEFNINGTNEVTSLDGTTITCDLDLTGAATGVWSVIVTNPDQQVCIIPVTFTINAEQGQGVCHETNYAQWPRTQRDVSWDDYGHASYSGGASMASKWTNDFMTYKFTGTQIDVIGLKAPNRGKADVYIDDVLIGEINCYSATLDFQSVIFTQTFLTEVERTLKIVVKGLPGITPGGDNWVDVDAFDVTSGTGTVREESCEGRWFGTFTNYRHVSYSGGSTMASKDAGAFCTYDFTGSEVSWLTLKCPNRGIAEVWIDGVKEADVDCYDVGFLFQEAAFTRTWPTSGPHTIKVVVTGTHNTTGATDSWVDIDAFVVTP